ncbi:hypothetical protein Salpa_3554 [Sporomusa sp. KB1]|jgi:hypothetical protein|nr:hypothetical protein Salpa_3554 [Sporomusa sp. KB1]
MQKNMRKRNPTIFVNASHLVVLQGFVIRDGFVFPVSASPDSVFPVNAFHANVSRASVSRVSVPPDSVSQDSVFLVDKSRKRPVPATWSLFWEG